MYAQQALSQIVEGMEVYDNEGNQIGTVETFRHGEGTIKTSETDIVTIVETVSETLGSHKELPTVIYTRLFDEGFVRVKRGLFRRDVLVFTQQIDDANGVSVHLNVRQDDLTKI